MIASRSVVTIYGLDEAVVAAKASLAENMPIYLLSAQAAAGYAGPAWFYALFVETKKRVPKADIYGILDCGRFSGHAAAALREGLKLIVYDGPAHLALDDIAGQYGAIVLRERPRSLDTRLAAMGGSLDEIIRAWLIN